MRRRAAGTVRLALCGLVAVAAACISERAPTGPQLSGDCSASLPPAVAGSTVIVVRDFAFQPASVTIRPGQSVTWINCSASGDPAHTATADGGAWASPEFTAGETYSWTFTQAGTFAYHCEPHPFMVAQVVVQP